jgi:hypothetical protein
MRASEILVMRVDELVEQRVHRLPDELSRDHQLVADALRFGPVYACAPWSPPRKQILFGEIGLHRIGRRRLRDGDSAHGAAAIAA